ncbi:hypothetical protein WR25_09149 [Diploscapter pachys]|uniref:SAM domain-containing protein n=1 Tax=Diploscapter pachys TaxID=2018661 RepID=A0A2A2LIF0_9BILA|nr:hypothetical protein WR25_09149 [Diploscapter pachys]
MSYEQMMQLNDEQLEQLQVTKGARRKILQSVEKLKERPKVLKEWQANLTSRQKEACVRCAICVIRQMLSTPLMGLDPEGKATGSDLEEIDGLLQPCVTISDSNIPALIVRTVGIIQQHIFPSSKYCAEVEDEYLLMLFSIFDRIVNNEAFTIAQKQRVLQWKKLARKFVCPSELRKHRMLIPYAGKCEHCYAKEQFVQKVASIAGCSSGLDPQMMSLFQNFCKIMNVPADNEHLQRFFMVLQSNAAAQNLQANIMAATLQSQATQIINNQILANQKAHHLHQMLQQSQSMRQSPPQKRIPRRVESRPEETPIMPMGCSQQARKPQLQAINIPQYRSAPNHIPMTSNGMRHNNEQAREIENNDVHLERNVSQPMQIKPQVTRKDAATSPHINNQMQPSAALMQQRANIMQRQNNQVSQQPVSSNNQINMQCWPSAIYSSNDIVTLQNQLEEQVREANALNLSMNPWVMENEATSGYSSCTSDRGSCSGAGSPRTRHESGVTMSTRDGFNHAILLLPSNPTPTPATPSGSTPSPSTARLPPTTCPSSTSSPRRPSAVFPEPLNTNSLTLGDMDPQFERAFNVLLTNLNLNCV